MWNMTRIRHLTWIFQNNISFKPLKCIIIVVVVVVVVIIIITIIIIIIIIIIFYCLIIIICFNVIASSVFLISKLYQCV